MKKQGDGLEKQLLSKNNNTEIKEIEIDILALSKKEKCYLIGECKFKESPFSYSEYLDTLAKLEPLKKNNKIYYALFSKNGFDENILEEKNDQLLLFNLKDMSFD